MQLINPNIIVYYSFTKAMARKCALPGKVML